MKIALGDAWDRRLRGALCTGLVLVSAALALTQHFVKSAATAVAATTAAITLGDPNAACAGCHREIYDRYSRTPMARASGLAAQGLIQGGFIHAASGVKYELFLRDGNAFLSYSRKHSSPLRQIAGEQELQLYVGSGHRGRTYLFENQGLWFETPVNYYGKKQLWDMAPAFGSAQQMPFTLPVDSNCLHCHAGEVQTALPGARNRYATAPFLVGGVPCSGCHGDAKAHLAQKGHGPILNPAKLPPVKRDSVCLQCHLEGEAVVYRPGMSLASFTPGKDLSDYAVYFVDKLGQGQEGRATSQWEALLKSACRRGSGDKLTCTTCHDPHGSPSAAERVEFYRAKCLSCHTSAAFATKHHPEQRDCASCHMPARNSDDISHEQVTNHRILRQPDLTTATLTPTEASANFEELVPVGNAAAGDREYGLAYAQKAQHGNQQAAKKALARLERAQAAGANDVDVHVELGFLRQLAQDRAAARKEYLAALAIDPQQTTALANLAVLDAAQGHADDAIKLLRRVVQADPADGTSASNLAFLECSTGDLNAAKKTLNVLLSFSPDDAPARRMLERWASGKSSCSF